MWKLNQDVLWLIFLELAEFQDLSPCWPHQKGSSPLTNLRYASQVCSPWRNFILKSCSLWGRVIDINSLRRSADDWTNKILQRTGSSCLHVQAVIRRDDDLQRFTKALLLNEWHRIRSLEIMFTTTLQSQEDLENWKVLQTPAPKLERLYVDCTPPSRHTFANNFELFTNHAPMLHSFSGLTLQINAGASWLSNLRYMRFTSSFTASELLDILERTPLLENFQISADPADCHVHVIGSTPLPQVILSKLQYIAIHTIHRPDSVPKYLDILLHISPPSGCALFLPNLSLIPTTSTLEAAKKILRSYIKIYVQGTKASTDWVMHMANNSFHVYSGPFSFDVTCSKGFADPAVILESLSSSAYDSVKHLAYTSDSTAITRNCADQHHHLKITWGSHARCQA